jgi:TolB-like protein/DNA-binding winged helix-turn-helix (wHTH) protein/Tfp pilus assembly protein PilF
MSSFDAPASTRLRFGVFELDLPAGELRKAGRRIRLSGQPLQILEALLRRPGEIVTRDDLQRELWPDQTFVDFERNLNSAVKRLRAALGDSADSPRFIETLPRRGYRFLVAVEFEPLPLGSPSSPVAQHAPAARRPRISRAVRVGIIGVGALAMALVLMAWRARVSRQPAFEPGQVTSLAVLPFQNLSSDPDQVHFADGMTEALITHLAQIKSLRVISRTSVMAYKTGDRRVPQIAKELMVDAVVEGSVMRAGDQVRITAQLIHGPTDRHLWAASYDGRLSDILALQSQVARAIAHEVNVSLSPPEEAMLHKTASLDPAVHELYLRGRHLLVRRTESDVRRALEYFEQAVRQDPEYALAYVGIAQAWDALASWPAYVAPREGYPRAKAAALRALSIDSNLAEAQTALASVHELYDWDLAAAERRYARAIAINPNYAVAHHLYGQLLARTGRSQAGLEAGKRARALDPLSPEMNIGLAQRLDSAGQPKEALAQMLVAVELDHNYFDAYVHLADLYQRHGFVAEAVAAAQRGVELSGRSAHAVHGLAVIYARQKDFAKAKALIAELEARPVQRNSYDIAMLYLEMGASDSALRWLERACTDRTPAMGFLRVAQSGRRFDMVRDAPRFRQILDCVEKELI